MAVLNPPSSPDASDGLPDRNHAFHPGKSLDGIFRLANFSEHFLAADFRGDEMSVLGRRSRRRRRGREQA